MADIRPCRPGDLEALYAVALATGDAGGDAAKLYRDRKLVGHLYAAPYAILEPGTAFVVEDEQGVAGYILGAVDTRAFEALAEKHWWPTLRPRYRDPMGTPPSEWTPDQRLSYLIHHPWRAPARIVEPFPSHLHIDLLPRLQGQGLGRRLMDRWLETARARGSTGVHLGVSAANTRAMRFYRAYGLTEPVLAKPPPAGVVWFAVKFEGG
jgi:ribosomal protein S18 acetylase RimI-like enzyme